MTLGEKIKKYRVEKGYTQKEIADLSNVTFQTVSKWENDENEPDVHTLRKLASLFGCSLDDLLSEEDAPRKEQAATQTVIIQKELHVCAKCGKDIPEEELASEDVFKRERHGRVTRSVNVGQTYYHKDCLEQVKQQRAEEERKLKAEKIHKVKVRSFGWAIFGGVVTLAILLASFLLAGPETIHPGLAVLWSVISGYGIFAMIYCIISGSYIGNVFLWAASLSIKFPGLIFTWDLGGFVWLIAMKILFAVLAFLIGVFALAFAIVLSAALAFVSFPFVLIHNIRTEYADSFLYM